MPSTVGKSYIKEEPQQVETFVPPKEPPAVGKTIIENFDDQSNYQSPRIYVDSNPLPQQYQPVSTMLQPQMPYQPPPVPPPQVIETDVVQIPATQPFSWSNLPDPSQENIVDYVALSYKIANTLRGSDPIAYKQCSNFYKNDNTAYIIIIIFLLICCMYFYKTNNNNEI
tara:strand:+ start:436 stop:942 length:507 start_codon:yes stop_codon:yes gene_type:complete